MAITLGDLTVGENVLIGDHWWEVIEPVRRNSLGHIVRNEVDVARSESGRGWARGTVMVLERPELVKDVRGVGEMTLF